MIEKKFSHKAIKHSKSNFGILDYRIIKACRQGNTCSINMYMKHYQGKVPIFHQKILLETAVISSHPHIVQLFLGQYKFNPNLRNSKGVFICALSLFKYYFDKKNNKLCWIPRKFNLTRYQLEILSIFISNNVDINSSVWINGPTILSFEEILINSNDNKHVRCDAMIAILLRSGVNSSVSYSGENSMLEFDMSKMSINS